MQVRMAGALLLVLLPVVLVTEQVHAAEIGEVQELADAGGKGLVVSSKAFLQRLRIPLKEGRRDRGRLPFHRPTRKQKHEAPAFGLSHVKAARRSKRGVPELGESLATTVNEQKLSNAEQARLNLEAAQAFPKQGQKIRKLHKQLAPIAVNVMRLRQSRRHLHDAVERRTNLLDKIEGRHEFDLMTNPSAEQAQLSAETKLRSLTKQERGLYRQEQQATQSGETLAKQLAKEEELQEENRKAVLLFRKYKANFKKHYLQQMALSHSKFKAHSLKAAESAAKKKYHKYAALIRRKMGHSQDSLKTTIRKMQQEQKVQSRTRALRRAARLAKEEMRMHKEAKEEAQAMFKQYVTRYHEMQQRETMEDTQELGESSDVGEKHPKKNRHDVDLNALSADLDSVSRRLHVHKEQHAFGLDS